jgi:hypothetical protein
VRDRWFRCTRDGGKTWRTVPESAVTSMGVRRDTAFAYRVHLGIAGQRGPGEHALAWMEPAHESESGALAQLSELTGVRSDEATADLWEEPEIDVAIRGGGTG